VAFAPRENPKIAIAVVVENSGDGGDYAAPIASFIIEKYLKGEVTKRESGISPEGFMNMNLLPDLSLYQHDLKREQRRDSIRSAKADSIKKLKADSIKKAAQMKTAKNNKPGSLADLFAGRRTGK
jgi:penicillin-binding protein 2